MNLEPMRYKDFVWPHNPRVYSIAYERKIAVGKVPFGRYVMQNMGMTYRVLRGEGEFYGPGAYDQFRRLATVFYEDKPGLLVHPLWQLSNAYFVGLSLNQEPTEDYVSYSFEFWECYDDYNLSAVRTPGGTDAENGSGTAGATTGRAGETMIHTVVSGDTMWAIAVRNGLTLQELLALNPQVKNPNLIYPGDKICVSKGATG